MKRLSILALLLLVCCSVSLVNTQEVLVPLDQTGKLTAIDAQLEKNLKLFTEYTNFHEARLFQIDDSSFVLEVYYQPAALVYKERILLSSSEVAELRSDITESMRIRSPLEILNQEGRPELLIGALGLSMGYYGWAVPVALGVDDPKVGVALYMLTSGASFFAPFIATQHISVSNGAASLSLYGGTRGIAHGICAGLAVFGEDSTMRIPIASGMALSIAEAIVGFQLASKMSMDPGRAEVIGIGGDFGMGIGLGAAYLADFLNEDDQQFRSVGGSVLLGAGAGLLAGSWLANRQHYTQGDANVLRAAGFLGAYVPLAMVGYADPENNKVYPAASMAGAIIGLGMGNLLVKEKDFSSGQGRLITFSEFAGGLVGLGCAYLIASEDGDNRNLFLSSSAMGGLAGFFFMYRAFSGEAKKGESNSSWNINIAPEGLLSLTLNRGKGAHPACHIPFVRAQYRF